MPAELVCSPDPQEEVKFLRWRIGMLTLDLESVLEQRDRAREAQAALVDFIRRHTYGPPENWCIACEAEKGDAHGCYEPEKGCELEDILKKYGSVLKRYEDYGE